MFWHLEDIVDSNIAIYDDFLKRNITYGELKQQSDDLVTTVKSDYKKLVFVFCDNSFLSVLVYLSMLRRGHAVFLANGTMDSSLKTNLIGVYQPDLIWSIDLGDCFDGYDPLSGIDNVTFHIKKKQNRIEIHPDLALLLSTSGTTGSPKLVRLSYKNIQANAESIVNYLEITRDERAITTLPLHYSYGLSVFHSHLLAGATLVCTNQSVIAKPFWEVFREQSCTSIAGVPFTYQMLDRLRFDRMELPSLRTMTQAGGRLDNERIRKFSDTARQKNIRFFVMYGETEATARISYVPYSVLPQKIGSIGIPIPGGAMSVFYEGKEITEPNIDGELVYKGNNVMMGYSENRGDLSHGDEMNGVLHTGDLAYQDQKGYFFVTGRMKRFLKIFGLRLNLDDVEETLESHLSKAVACAGNDDKLKIVVETKDRKDLEEASNYVIDLYHLHHSVIHTAGLDILPRTSSGKKDYKEIERRDSNEQP
jgi:acyl-coenzyme A synthetase/AMP-(fatty) acid ligase